MVGFRQPETWQRGALCPFPKPQKVSARIKLQKHYFQPFHEIEHSSLKKQPAL